MINVDNMSDYVKANSDILIKDIIMAGTSLQPAMGLNIYSDVKTATDVVDVSSISCILQSGNPTDSKALGDDVLDTMRLENTQLTLHKLYDTYTIDKKLTQLAKKQGSAPDDDAYLSVLVDLTAQMLVLENDKMLWRGDKSKGGNLGKFDGFTKQLTDAVTANVDGFTPQVSGNAPVRLTSENAIEIVEHQISVFADTNPAQLEFKVKCFMSPENLFTYRRVVSKQNGGIDSLTIGGDSNVVEFQIPGTQIWATSVPGLATDNNIIVGRAELFIPVTDLETENSKLTFEYISAFMKYRLMAIYKLGAKVADKHFSEIVISHL